MSCITALHGIRQCLFPSCSQVSRLHSSDETVSMGTLAMASGVARFPEPRLWTPRHMSGKRCDQACGLLPRIPRHWATIPRGQPMYCAFASRLLILRSEEHTSELQSHL